MKKLLCLLSLSILLIFSIGFTTTYAQDYYVSNSGNDSNSGISLNSPWQSLSKVNGFDFAPGDVIHFKKGDIWRGQVIPKSGNSNGYVTYTSYGEGEKPVILGSVDRSDKNDWKNLGNNIWALSGLKGTTKENIIPVEDIGFWNNQNANANYEVVSDNSNNKYIKVSNVNAGSSSSDIQVIIDGLKIEDGKNYTFSFRAKSSSSFKVPYISLIKNHSPWTGSFSSHTDWSPVITTSWTSYSVSYQANTNDDDGSIRIFLGKDLPQNAEVCIDSFSFSESESSEIYKEVGNIIFNQGKEFGIKVFKEEDLKKQNQYWYDKQNSTVKMYSTNNPGEIYNSIECAITQNIIEQGNKSYVEYDGLALRYGGAHGIGGGDTHHIIVKNCDVSYIGGGELYMNGKYVRFGNGVEFWNNAHDNLVENNNIWEIYDAAVTNQGDGKEIRQYNITYRNNNIWNAEYSFEYWNSSKNSKTENIVFENNTSNDAGYGWGHNQRPDPSGRHICFWGNKADTNGVYIRNNIFNNAKEVSFYITDSWNGLKTLTLENNQYFQDGNGFVVSWQNKRYSTNDFEKYQKDTGKDNISTVAFYNRKGTGTVAFK